MSAVIKLKKLLSIVLRIPGLFIAEAWYRNDPRTIHNQFTEIQRNVKEKVELDDQQRPHEILFYGLYYSAILLSVTLVTLPLKKLIHLYILLIGALLMVAAHHLSAQYVHWEQQNTHSIPVMEDAERMMTFGLYLVMQGIFSAIISYLVDLHVMSKMLLLILYTAPMLARACSVPVTELQTIHNCSTFAAILVIMLFTFNNIPVILDFVKESIQQISVAIHVYGWISFLVTAWFKLLLPVQFLTFWSILFIIQLHKYLSIENHPILAEGWLVVLLASIGECCLTPLSLIGLCVTVSYISYTILTLTKLFLQGRAAFTQDNILHEGWTEGFTMFLLAIQTGITDMDSAERAFLMSILLFIVISSLIQSMFEITDPLLLALGASQNKNIYKHIRAIAMCSFLWIMPLYMTFVICQFFDLDFWLMVVISSCVLTSVQVLGSMAVYALFIYDALLQEPWENLDDVVYVVKATTRVLEFIVALFVVGYGVNESLFGEWSFVNCSILVIHCYLNVWQRLQVGWKSYLLRREAARMVQSLPVATDSELLQHNDVCPICLLSLRSARITPCNHFFHATCMKKWLYVQEYCPLCHKKLTLLKQDYEKQDQQDRGGDQNDYPEELNDDGQHDGDRNHGDENSEVINDVPE